LKITHCYSNITNQKKLIMTNILIWILFGLIAGVIAKFLKPGPDGQGWVATIIIGVIGSVVGGFLGNLLFDKGVTNEIFSFYNMGMSVVGAIIVLYAYNAITKKS